MTKDKPGEQKREQLNIQISAQLKRELKALAAMEGISLQDYVERELQKEIDKIITPEARQRLDKINPQDTARGI